MQAAEGTRVASRVLPAAMAARRYHAQSHKEGMNTTETATFKKAFLGDLLPHSSPALSQGLHRESQVIATMELCGATANRRKELRIHTFPCI